MSNNQTASLKTFARQLNSFLVKKERANGTEFWAFNDELPKAQRDALRDLAHELHQAVDGCQSPRLPSDDVYRWLRIALCHMEYCDDIEDTTESIREAGAGGWICDADAIAWIARDLSWNGTLVDDVAEELGYAGGSPVSDIARLANYAAVEACCRVAEAVADAAERGFGFGASVDDYVDNELRTIVDNVDLAEIAESHASEDVLAWLEKLAPEDHGSWLAARIMEPQAWGYDACPASIIIPVGEVEVPLDGRHPAFVFADPTDVTVSGDCAYIAVTSMRIPVRLPSIVERV